MGSRAVLALFRDLSVGQAYVNRETYGTIVSRNNIRFFERDQEEQIVTKLVNDLRSYFDEMGTDVLLLDAEILPWNVKAAELIRRQYGLVANASLYTRQRHLDALRDFESIRNIDVGPEIQMAGERLHNARQFHRAFTYYCWDVNGLEGLQIAPFHVLAFHHKSNFDQTHEWHMQQAKQMAELSDLIVETPYMAVNTGDKAEVERAIQWWMETTEQGHEGFVFKPNQFLSLTESGEMVQPAIKV